MKFFNYNSNNNIDFSHADLGNLSARKNPFGIKNIKDLYSYSSIFRKAMDIIPEDLTINGFSIHDLASRDKKSELILKFSSILIDLIIRYNLYGYSACILFTKDKSLNLNKKVDNLKSPMKDNEELEDFIVIEDSFSFSGFNNDFLQVKVNLNNDNIFNVGGNNKDKKIIEVHKSRVLEFYNLDPNDFRQTIPLWTAGLVNSVLEYEEIIYEIRKKIDSNSLITIGTKTLDAISETRANRSQLDKFYSFWGLKEKIKNLGSYKSGDIIMMEEGDISSKILSFPIDYLHRAFTICEDAICASLEYPKELILNKDEDNSSITFNSPVLFKKNMTLKKYAFIFENFINIKLFKLKLEFKFNDFSLFNKMEELKYKREKIEYLKLLEESKLSEETLKKYNLEVIND